MLGLVTIFHGVAAIAPSAHAASTFQGIGFLTDGVASAVYDVAGDGSRVVGFSKTASDSYTALSWTQSNGTAAFCCSMSQTIAAAVSADGNAVLVTIEGEDGWLRWTPGSGLVPESATGTADDLSGDGTVVSGSSGSSGTAFRWTAATGAVSLGTLLGDSVSVAYGISADGQVIVGESIGTGIHAFRWSQADGMQFLGDFPGGTDSSSAKDVSADGSVVVGSSFGTDGREAFRWTAASGLVALPRIVGAGGESQSLVVSTDGSVVLGVDGFQATIWDAGHGMRLLADVLTTEYGLDLSGWALWSASGISTDRRTIAGNGYRNGVLEGWVAKLADPLPEPNAAAGGLAAAATIAACARRSKRQDVRA